MLLELVVKQASGYLLVLFFYMKALESNLSVRIRVCISRSPCTLRWWEISKLLLFNKQVRFLGSFNLTKLLITKQCTYAHMLKDLANKLDSRSSAFIVTKKFFRHYAMFVGLANTTLSQVMNIRDRPVCDFKTWIGGVVVIIWDRSGMWQENLDCWCCDHTR